MRRTGNYAATFERPINGLYESLWESGSLLPLSSSELARARTKTMPIQPVRSDAWLLAALVYGKGDPDEVMGAAEGLNRTIPLHGEWEHACVVLGERGLAEATTTFLQATTLGTALVERITSRKGIGLFRVADFVLREIERAPIIGHPVALPDAKPFDTAYHLPAKKSNRSQD